MHRCWLAVVCALALTGSVLCEGDVDEKDVIVLTEKNFDEIVKPAELILVEFYAPWCGHCKKLTPEYAKAATTLKGEGILLGKVDATVESGLGSKYGVNGYPTLKIFRNGEHSDYNGPREHNGIVSYMRKQSGPSSKELKTLEEIEALQAKDEPTIVGFFVNPKSSEAKAFHSVANSLRDKFKFAHTSEASILDKHGYREAIVILKPYDDQKTLFSGTATQSSVEDFIYKNFLPLAGVITKDNAEIYQRKGNPVLKVLVDVDVQRNKKQADYYLNRLRKAAKELPGISFALAARSEWGHENEKFGLTAADKEPLLLEDASGNLKYRHLNAKFSTDAVKAFAQDYIDGKVKPYIKSEPHPGEHKKGDVVTVTGETFNEVVLDKTKDVLIEMYAPWCGHCKSLAPKYEQLAKELEDVESVVIAKFDATANDSPHAGYQARGYPTILFAPANNKDSPIKYEGEREVAGFKKWLKQKASIPFELPKEAEGEKKKKKKKE